MPSNNSTNTSALSSSLNNAIDRIKKIEDSILSISNRTANAEANISNNSDSINQLKMLDDKWNANTGGSYDPQLPYHIHRKNEKYDYAVLSFIVTDADINNQLDFYGNQGWMAISMGTVEESSSSSEVTFKKLENSNVKFNYVCFKYEVKATKKFSKTLNDRNNDGYDFTTSAIFNKSASFCLMTKPIY